MIASVYIKDGNIYFFNERNSLSNLGGLIYELGRALLDFICYDPDMFNDGFPAIASAYDHEFSYLIARKPEFIDSMRESMGEFQQKEIYVYFYKEMLMNFIYTFADSPRKAIEQLSEQIPGAEEKLQWAMEFEWPVSKSEFVEVVMFADKEKRLYRAAMDVVSLMSEDLKSAQEATIYEIELLLKIRESMGAPEASSMEYLYELEALHHEHTGHFHFLEKPFKTFYGITNKPPEIVELYEIKTLKDLLRFEFIKMIERDIFIKKCKNCEHFFMPRRRVDAEYCDRLIGDGPRRCSEIGAQLRYERKVAGNPILEAYSKAYKRFNSRTRAKKMTQGEFLNWSEQARKMRDECVDGEVSLEEFQDWLEQGRVRKSKNSPRVE